MLRALLLSVSLLACSKAADKPAPVETKAADGTRVIAVEAGTDGYVPAEIAGKPGEKLVLKFTRTVEGDCLAKVKFPDGKAYDLPMNTPTDVAVTVPQTGKIEFVCAMDMFKGTIVPKT